MPEEVGGLLLTNGKDRVFFHPPVNPHQYGFSQRIDLVGGPFQGSIDAYSHEGLGALRGFHAQLVALYDCLQGEALLPNSYDSIKLKLFGVGLGHISVDVFVMVFPGTQLSFCFGIDQTQLPPIIAAVNKLFLCGEPHE